MTDEQKQSVVDAAVWEMGSNFPNDSASKKFLKRHKMSPDQVTEDMISRAARRARTRLKEGFMEFNKIARDKGIRKQFVVEGDSDLDPELNPEMEGTAKYRSEIAAKKKEEMIKRLDDLRKKRELSLAHPDNKGDGQTTTNRKGNVMDISVKQARALLADLGVEEGAEWSTKKLGIKLNSITEVLDKATKSPKEKSDSAKLLTAINKSLQEGNPIMVSEDGTKPAKPSKATKPTKGTKADPKSTETDKFGSPKGSNNAIVSSVLGKKPLSFAQIVEKTGLSRGQVRYSHLDDLVARKLATKTKEGWTLK